MEERRVVGIERDADARLDQPVQRMGLAVRIQAQCNVAAGTDLEDDAAARQLGHQSGIVGRAHAVADAGHRQVGDRRPHAFRAQNLAGMDGAAEALVVGQPIGRREVGGREPGLVAAHAEAHDVVMRLGHHGLRHGERPLGPEMADADDDDTALDAEVAPGAIDAAFERLEPGVVGDAQRRRALGRAEHLDIDRALARDAGKIGIDDVAEIARRAQGRADEVVGGEEAQKILPHIVAVVADQAGRNAQAVAGRQLARQRRRDRALEMAMQFGLGNHENPRSGRSGLCSQLSAGYSARPSIRCKA